MFGRRRRPILGTALVIGASRASARHEVQRQVAAQSQREFQIQQEVEYRSRQKEEEEARIQRAAEAKQRQKEEEEARIQRAVEEAIKAQTAAAPTPPVAAPIALVPGMPPPPPPPYAAQGMGGPVLQPVPVLAPEAQNCRYCPGCGNACELMDRFCSSCGLNLKKPA